MDDQILESHNETIESWELHGEVVARATSCNALGRRMSSAEPPSMRVAFMILLCMEMMEEVLRGRKSKRASWKKKKKGRKRTSPRARALGLLLQGMTIIAPQIHFCVRSNARMKTGSNTHQVSLNRIDNVSRWLI